MRIGPLDTATRVVIVAEIGNNHEGDAAVARRLVEAAADAGADGVKFQTFRTEHYVAPSDAARVARLKSFELPAAAFADLASLAHARGLLFVSTPFDLESVDVLEPLVDAFKISSGDATFYPLLERVARTATPMIVSTGLCDMAQVERTVAFVRDRRPTGAELAVLHCVSAYPVEPGCANLGAIRTLADQLRCDVGYSDHTLGIDACVASAAAGARIIEKHFTLDKTYSAFRDHQLSADPDDLRRLVAGVRQMETMLGTGEKVLQACEAPLAPEVRRAIAAAADLAAGHRLRTGDLTWLRAVDGAPAGDEHLLVGKVLKHDVRYGDGLRAADVEDARV